MYQNRDMLGCIPLCTTPDAIFQPCESRSLHHVACWPRWGSAMVSHEAARFLLHNVASQCESEKK